MGVRSAVRRHRDVLGDVVAVHHDRPGTGTKIGFILAWVIMSGLTLINPGETFLLAVMPSIGLLVMWVIIYVMISGERLVICQRGMLVGSVAPFLRPYVIRFDQIVVGSLTPINANIQKYRKKSNFSKSATTARTAWWSRRGVTFVGPSPVDARGGSGITHPYQHGLEVQWLVGTRATSEQVVSDITRAASAAGFTHLAHQTFNTGNSAYPPTPEYPPTSGYPPPPQHMPESGSGYHKESEHFAKQRTPRAQTAGPLSILMVTVGLALGLVATFYIIIFWPQLLALGIIIGVFVLIGALIAVGMMVRQKWVPWVMIPCLAVLGIGTFMFAEDSALTARGEQQEVRVVDHSLETSKKYTSGRASKVYTHEYELEDTSGQTIDERLIYRGKNGYDFEPGDRITVLIDPEGSAPMQPADSVNPRTGYEILLFGTIITLGSLVASAIVLGVRRSRTKARAQNT